MLITKKVVLLTAGSFLIVGACALIINQFTSNVPADEFDLTRWKITLPIDADGNGKIDEVKSKKLQSYSHPDFFYLTEEKNLFFAAPNKAITTKNSSNTRSELRQMLRNGDTNIKTRGAANNFALPENEKGIYFGGKMNATLKVHHVAKRAGVPDSRSAYSVVIGQIHANKDKDKVAEGEGFGWGNEPLKIFYKKWPDHEKGSIFWTYERNLEKENEDRTDLVYPVWGNTWENKEEPENGIVLGEEFSYEVNVHDNIMYLTFSSANQETVKQQINLADNVDANGNIDEKDHPRGYAEDLMYFKAGVYNQCSTTYAKCAGTGNWEVDKANGDYVSATFSELVVSESTKP